MQFLIEQITEITNSLGVLYLWLRALAMLIDILGTCVLCENYLSGRNFKDQMILYEEYLRCKSKSD